MYVTVSLLDKISDTCKTRVERELRSWAKTKFYCEQKWYESKLITVKVKVITLNSACKCSYTFQKL